MFKSTTKTAPATTTDKVEFNGNQWTYAKDEEFAALDEDKIDPIDAFLAQSAVWTNVPELMHLNG